MILKKYNNRQLLIQYLYRKRYKNHFLLLVLLKLIIKNKFIENQFKVLSIFYFSFLNKKVFKSYHKNICLTTSNKRSVFKFFKLNRLTISDNLNELVLPGIKKHI